VDVAEVTELDSQVVSSDCLTSKQRKRESSVSKHDSDHHRASGEGPLPCSARLLVFLPSSTRLGFATTEGAGDGLTFVHLDLPLVNFIARETDENSVLALLASTSSPNTPKQIAIDIEPSVRGQLQLNVELARMPNRKRAGRRGRSLPDDDGISPKEPKGLHRRRVQRTHAVVVASRLLDDQTVGTAHCTPHDHKRKRRA
jgi:hypothetical protein